MATEILIIGLDTIGASISLALSQIEADLSITGYDPDSKVAQAARKRGDVRRIAIRPAGPARSADLIFLSLPPSDVRDHLEFLAPLMRPEAVLLDFSPIKAASLAWAEALIPQDRYYIGLAPVINAELLLADKGKEMLPHADLFRGGLVALTIPANMPEKVFDLALGIAKILGAKPFFIDPHELDAISAMVDGLPSLLSSALMRISLQAPSWREIQRIAGRPWAIAANTMDKYQAKELAGMITLNKECMMHRLNELIEELETLRVMISEEQEEALIKRFEEASSTYSSWLAQRRRGDLEYSDLKPPSIPRTGLLERLFGSSLFKREE
jgi:prephenate dehydrogenase